MKCLLCYKPLSSGETDYHASCVMRIFGVNPMPRIDIDEKRLTDYARKIIGASTTITGVQPKLSLWLEEIKNKVRFTIIDGKSNYIIKPQSETYTFLPENEDLCMHLSEAFGIRTAVHGLVRLPGGSLAYITRRFDREGDSKLACEDLCQLTETLTENKYRGSHEKAGKAIKQFSTRSGLDLLHYFELIVFCFITGNADMHLKNFSLLESKEGHFSLSPAYDLVSTLLVIKKEDEQLSLSVNGKRNRLSKKDFAALAKSLQLHDKQIENCYQSFLKKSDKANAWIDNSFLPDDQKEKLQEVIFKRIKLLAS